MRTEYIDGVEYPGSDSPKIITISGKARHGKDTAAEILKELYEAQGYRVAITRYAAHIKDIYRRYFEWDGEKTDEAREFLQWLGTERIRAIDPGWHVKVTMDEIRFLHDCFDVFIIPDCRFSNEVMRCENGYNIKVIRTNYESELTAEQQAHESETALDGYDGFDLVVTAESGDIESIRAQLERLVEECS